MLFFWKTLFWNTFDKTVDILLVFRFSMELVSYSSLDNTNISYIEISTFQFQNFTLFSRAHCKRKPLYQHFNYPLRCLTLYSPAHFKTHLLPILNFALCNLLQTSTHTSLHMLKFWYSYGMPCFVFQSSLHKTNSSTEISTWSL